jgi:hypothetical protein
MPSECPTTPIHGPLQAPRGKPSPIQLAKARGVDLEELRDPEPESLFSPSPGSYRYLGVAASAPASLWWRRELEPEHALGLSCPQTILKTLSQRSSENENLDSVSLSPTASLQDEMNSPLVFQVDME